MPSGPGRRHRWRTQSLCFSLSVPPRRKREQKEHHPGAGRIVSDLMVGFAAERVFKVMESRAAGKKQASGRSAPRFAADIPQQPKDSQREQG